MRAVLAIVLLQVWRVTAAGGTLVSSAHADATVAAPAIVSPFIESASLAWIHAAEYFKQRSPPLETHHADMNRDRNPADERAQLHAPPPRAAPLVWVVGAPLSGVTYLRRALASLGVHCVSELDAEGNTSGTLLDPTAPRCVMRMFGHPPIRSSPLKGMGGTDETGAILTPSPRVLLTRRRESSWYSVLLRHDASVACGGSSSISDMDEAATPRSAVFGSRRPNANTWTAALRNHLDQWRTAVPEQSIFEVDFEDAQQEAQQAEEGRANLTEGSPLRSGLMHRLCAFLGLEHPNCRSAYPMPAPRPSVEATSASPVNTDADALARFDLCAQPEWPDSSSNAGAVQVSVVQTGPGPENASATTYAPGTSDTSAQPKSGSPPRYAYATVLAGLDDGNAFTAEFLTAALVMCSTIRQTSNKQPDNKNTTHAHAESDGPTHVPSSYEVVALLLDGARADQHAALLTCFDRVIDVTDPQPQSDVPVSANVRAGAGPTPSATPRGRFWRVTEAKLIAFGLTDYARVVLMDADQIVRKSMDHLFFRSYYEHKYQLQQDQSYRNSSGLPNAASASDELVTPLKPLQLYALSTLGSPLHSGLLSLQPCSFTARELFRALRVGRGYFTAQSGWFAHGLFDFQPANWHHTETDGQLEPPSIADNASNDADTDGGAGVTSLLEQSSPHYPAPSRSWRLSRWTFPGAHSAQGLLFYYFFLLYPSRGGLLPPAFFLRTLVHFDGNKKPWMHSQTRRTVKAGKEHTPVDCDAQLQVDLSTTVMRDADGLPTGVSEPFVLPARWQSWVDLWYCLADLAVLHHLAPENREEVDTNLRAESALALRISAAVGRARRFEIEALSRAEGRKDRLRRFVMDFVPVRQSRIYFVRYVSLVDSFAHLRGVSVVMYCDSCPMRRVGKLGSERPGT
jgi:hypothetical protein